MRSSALNYCTETVLWYSYCLKSGKVVSDITTVHQMVMVSNRYYCLCLQYYIFAFNCNNPVEGYGIIYKSLLNGKHNSRELLKAK